MLLACLCATLSTAGGTWSAFSATTANTGNTSTAAADWTPPTITAQSAVAATAGRTGHVYPNASYRLYASATDNGSPAAGMGTVSANATNLTTWSVSDAGDVNGDGKPDQLIGANLADSNGRADSGTLYVVFGKATTSTIDLAALGGGGFRIDGAAAGDQAGVHMAGAGDINGDGRADQVVAARSASANSRAGSGSAYVVYGKASTTDIDLAALGMQGWAADGGSPGDGMNGVTVAPDTNGDGRTDLLFGSARKDTASTDAGGAMVLWRPTCP